MTDNGPGNGGGCIYETSNRQIELIETIVGETAAREWRKTVFPTCSPVDGLGVFSLNCPDSRGIQVYMPNGFLVAFSVNDLPMNTAANGTAQRAQALTVARLATPLISTEQPG